MNLPDIRTIVAYTADPWDSVLPIVRYRRAAEGSGLQVTRGNDGEYVYLERVSLADVVIVQRDFPRFTTAYEQVLTQARAEGKPVIYETDDLLLELPEGHIARQNISDVLFPILRATIEADAVTASTPSLCAYLRPFNPNTWLLPNYLDDQLWTFRSAQPAEPDGAAVVIGYMGGETHLPDLEFIAPLLEKILQKYGEQVALRFWGGRPPEKLLDSPRVEWIPINQINYAEFAQFFTGQSCHLFIAPLQDNLFNRCKSAIKYLEYSTQAVPGVYSRIPAYEEIVENGVNGFLAATLEEWETSISRLVETPSLRSEMGQRAQQTVRDRWLLSQHCSEWVEVYEKARALMEKPQPIRFHQAGIVLRVARQVELRQRELEQAVQALSAQVAEKEQTVQALSAQLADILNSRSWQFLQRVQRIRQKLIPLGSRREKSLQILFRR